VAVGDTLGEVADFHRGDFDHLHLCRYDLFNDTAEPLHPFSFFLSAGLALPPMEAILDQEKIFSCRIRPLTRFGSSRMTEAEYCTATLISWPRPIIESVVT